jgi:hypothetical protein
LLDDSSGLGAENFYVTSEANSNGGNGRRVGVIRIKKVGIKT